VKIHIEGHKEFSFTCSFFILSDVQDLYMQVFQLKKALCSLDKNYAAQDEKYTCMSLTRNDI
jgi:hypothetical protein